MHVWRDRLSRWFTPLAQRSPLSPNAITIIALVLNVVAAVCMYAGRARPALFFAALVFIALGGLCDAFDGIVARAQDKSSRFGDFLDHSADRVSDAAVAAGWMMGSGVRQELMIAAIILVGMNGYMGTQIEATYNQRNYETVGRGEFVLALIVFPIVSFILVTNGWSALRFGTMTIAEWLTIALIAFALFGIGQRIALATRLERTR
jgi:archaetidylinositol phosphate synthase